jgi:hypothetical protein
VEYVGFLIPLVVVIVLGVAVQLKKSLRGYHTQKWNGRQFFGS